MNEPTLRAVEAGILTTHEHTGALCEVEKHLQPSHAADDAVVGTGSRVDGGNDDETVDFSPRDPLNPVNWSLGHKWTIVVLVSVMQMLGTFGTTTIVPVAPQILRDFHVTKNIYLVLLVSIWELGEGVGPFLYGPLSELYGRLPIYHAGNVLFVLCLTGSALSKNMSMLIAFRFLSGFVTTSLTLGPSIVADMFEKEQRGTVMAFNLVLPIVGPLAAPIVGSYTGQAKGWRWTIWIVVFAAAGLTLLSFVFFRETYSVEILRRKTKRLRKVTGNERLRSKHQETTDKVTFLQSLARPMSMLIFSPVVTIVVSYTAVAYGINYVIFTTLAEVMESEYGFTQGPVGLAFLANTTGNIVGMAVYALVSDRYLRHKAVSTGTSKPEHRLPLMLLGAALMPLGLLVYGWTAEYRVQWAAPLFGTGVVGFSLVLALLPTENYLVDVYELYGASAVAAGVIVRAFFCAFFPLVSAPLYGRLGLGWGNSVLALMAAAFIPAVSLLMRHGERLRGLKRSMSG